MGQKSPARRGRRGGNKQQRSLASEAKCGFPGTK